MFDRLGQFNFAAAVAVVVVVYDEKLNENHIEKRTV